ncbi:hypothetical protein Hanom_Chr00s000012g01616601 [Helianthus anomalus]
MSYPLPLEINRHTNPHPLCPFPSPVTGDTPTGTLPSPTTSLYPPSPVPSPVRPPAVRRCDGGGAASTNRERNRRDIEERERERRGGERENARERRNRAKGERRRSRQQLTPATAGVAAAMVLFCPTSFFLSVQQVLISSLRVSGQT